MTVSITGVIQAGGKSTRMGGEPKALLELGGRRIVERVLDVLRAVADPVLLVTNTPELYRFLGLPMIADVFPDGGSLGGIYSGLLAAPGEVAFTMACDMPFVSPAVARLVTRPARRRRMWWPRASASSGRRSTPVTARAASAPWSGGCARVGSRSPGSSTRCGCSRYRRRRSRGWPTPPACS